LKGAAPTAHFHYVEQNIVLKIRVVQYHAASSGMTSGFEKRSHNIITGAVGTTFPTEKIKFLQG